MNKECEKKIDYSVNEIFRSIQGEGVYQGQPTIFVRFTGCNLRCSWCDTTYAYKEGNRTSLEELMESVRGRKDRNVCLTGGEPLLQEHIAKLTSSLLNDGYFVLLETNGSLDVDGFLEAIDTIELYEIMRRKIVISLDVKTPSSGEFKSFLFDNLAILSPWDQLKFVVNDKSDIDYALLFVEKNDIRSSVIIQPSDRSDLDDMARLFLDAVWPQGLDIRFMAQLHKIIWGKDLKGV
ncbi:MAG: radical SAM protein [Candidatus Thermoplasmatota archaeon]|jgi:7-carboxy-7-deazaguanine synthase|nr:radical SAM protein [Candidatus Thermoplasmatota archaeon]